MLFVQNVEHTVNPSGMQIMFVVYTRTAHDGVCVCVFPVYFGGDQLKGQHWRWGSCKRTPLVQVLDGSGFNRAEAL